MRLIDADALLRDFDLSPDGWMKGRSFERRINDAATVDAVPVVRCRECKHRHTDDCPMRHKEQKLDDLDGYDEIVFDRADNFGFCHNGARMDAEDKR